MKTSKIRRRWCKGKVGREHNYQIGIPYNSIWVWRIDICLACGRKRIVPITEDIRQRAMTDRLRGDTTYDLSAPF